MPPITESTFHRSCGQTFMGATTRPRLSAWVEVQITAMGTGATTRAVPDGDSSASHKIAQSRPASRRAAESFPEAGLSVACVLSWGRCPRQQRESKAHQRKIRGHVFSLRSNCFETASPSKWVPVSAGFEGNSTPAAIAGPFRGVLMQLLQ